MTTMMTKNMMQSAGPAIVNVAVNNIAPGAITDDDPVYDADPADAASEISVTTSNADDADDADNSFDDNDPSDAVIKVDVTTGQRCQQNVDDYFANDDTANAVNNIE